MLPGQGNPFIGIALSIYDRYESMKDFVRQSQVLFYTPEAAFKISLRDITGYAAGAALLLKGTDIPAWATLAITSAPFALRAGFRALENIIIREDYQQLPYLPEIAKVPAQIIVGAVGTGLATQLLAYAIH